MVVPNRSAWAFLILAVGLVAVVLFGGHVGSCLGPLGVTSIQCAEATGILPTVGLGPPLLAGAVLLAAIVGLPGLLTPLPQRLAAMAIGATVATIGFLVLRPTTWSGPTSTGAVITLQLPLDIGALATAPLLGAAVGVVAAWLAGRVEGRSGRGESQPA